MAALRQAQGPQTVTQGPQAATGVPEHITSSGTHDEHLGEATVSNNLEGLVWLVFSGMCPKRRYLGVVSDGDITCDGYVRYALVPLRWTHSASVPEKTIRPMPRVYQLLQPSHRERLRLQLVELVIRPLLCHQLRVRAALRQLSFIQHDQMRCIAQR